MVGGNTMLNFQSLTRIAAIGTALVAGLLAMTPGTAAAQTNGTWSATTGGSWPTDSNWTGSQIATGVSGSAQFSSSISGIQIVTLDGDRTIGFMRFTSAGSANIHSLQMGTSGTLTLQTSSGSPSIDVQNSRSGIIGVTLAGSQGFTKVGAGTLYLGGTSIYSGQTSISVGTLEVKAANALGTTGAGNETVVSSGARVRIGANVTVNESIQINGQGVGSVGALNIGSSDQVTTVTSATMAGLVTLGSDAAIGIAGSNVGTLDRFGAGDAIQTNGFNLTVVNTGSLTVNSPISGAGSLTVSGNGQLVLTAANTYTGTTGWTGAPGTLFLGNGGTGGSLSTNSAITLSNPNATLAINQNDTVTQGVDFSGSAITGNGIFNQIGTGTTILNAANSYNGATNVNAGTLLINGNQSAANGAVTVAAGATLGGSGTVGGNTTITGIHSPGNSPGIQTFNGNLTYEAGAVVNWELIANSTGSAGTNYDQIVLPTTGNLTFNGSTTLALSFNGAGSAVDWSNTFWNLNRSWMVYDLSAGEVSNAVNLVLGGSLLDSLGNSLSPTGRGYFTTSLSGQDVMLNFVAVPEPSTLVLLSGLAVGGLLLRRRRA